jgi:hypothetical protein
MRRSRLLCAVATIFVAFVLVATASAAVAAAGGEWVWPAPHGKDHGFPPAADASREKTLHFPDTPAWFKLRIAPAKGHVTCFILHFPDGSGTDQCPRDTATRKYARLNSKYSILRWHQTALLFGTVERGVASVDLTYADGAHASTKSKQGFVAFGIPKTHWDAIARRLVDASLRGSDGRVIRRITFDPKARYLGF